MSITQGTLFEENFLKREYKTLTTNPEVALTELVANAWDAGAMRVDITIPDRVGGRIVVADNGTGLSKDEFDERWRRLRYNRLARQGKDVQFPPGTNAKRQAFGRNGIGRHGLLCFSESYTVVSTKGGKRFTVEIDSTPDDPIHEKSYFEENAPIAEHGLRVEAVVMERKPDPSHILNVLSSRFVSDPAFQIFVNGLKVDTKDMKGLVCQATNIPVTGTINIDVLFFDTTTAHRKSIYQGIAFWQANRLVGEPSWCPGGVQVLDGRTTNARKFIFVVKSNDLAEYIKEDWTGFRDCEEVSRLYDVVRAKVIEMLAAFNRNHLDQIKEDVKHSYKEKMRELSALGRFEVNKTIENIAVSRPTASKEMIEVAVDAIVNVSQARQGRELFSKLSKLDPDQVDALNELLDNWDVRDALLVLEEIDKRISVVEAIRKLSSDKNTKELSTLHPLITEARWIFGPEFDSPEYTSNQQLRTIAKEIFHSDKGTFLNESVACKRKR